MRTERHRRFRTERVPQPTQRHPRERRNSLQQRRTRRRDRTVASRSLDYEHAEWATVDVDRRDRQRRQAKRVAPARWDERRRLRVVDDDRGALLEHVGHLGDLLEGNRWHPAELLPEQVILL